ncbi:glutamyl-tRNA synthetase [Acetobacter malorum DSM 14337]|uniref:Glutamyl-tRNA synthetase n=1 Tax=Acetobacter malorum DSM 14337 TaxID=1307910 RepID=A0ABQ0PLC4_9PROT|nr:tRNA glutamyl-Q(34) synthetase GluQRS [Acetobacter malorum]KXV08957.1 glutamyl-tRNA synthetase [Acetobacter malorum]GBQ75183.1 glutamyl-tRNA synthetase [Acetobacter malorum DSM 14337]
MTESSWVTRFAPSPTGFLHLGHVASALAGWTHKGPQGIWLVRMEDIDPQRCRESYAIALVEDLEWLGLRSARPVLRQSANMAAYRATLEHLDQMGVLYPCFCTRSDIARESAGMMSAPHAAPDGSLRYPGTCRHLSPEARAAALAEGKPHVLRLDMARALELVRTQAPTAWPLTYTDLERGTVSCQPELFGDVVLARRDVPASYHLCVTHDDAAQGVTLVTRGEDLRPATDLHRLIQALMGWPAPAYLFHPLLCDAEGRRLSKREGAKAVRTMREAGMTPEDVRRAAGYPGVFG